MLYFAYGSNMFLPRLKGRVSSVLFRGAASLSGYAFKWHKRSKDGSGKCSIVPSEGGWPVHGALFAVPNSELNRLEAAEGPGYQKIAVQVDTGDGCLSAETFVATPDWIDDSLRPYTWYRDIVIAGAVQAELPAEYVAFLRQVEAHDDPDRERDAKERLTLPADLEEAGKGKEYLQSLWDDPYDREVTRIESLEEKIGWLRPIVICGGAVTAIWLIVAAAGLGFWPGFLAIFVVLTAFKVGFAPLFALSSLGLSLVFHRLPIGLALAACLIAGVLLYADIRSWPMRRAQAQARRLGPTS
jgi:hypothetical protein